MKRLSILIQAGCLVALVLIFLQLKILVRTRIDSYHVVDIDTSLSSINKTLNNDGINDDIKEINKTLDLMYGHQLENAMSRSSAF